MKSIKYEPILTLIEKILTIARAGLKSRDLKEEKYLDVFWERLAQKQSPAMKIIASATFQTGYL